MFGQCVLDCGLSPINQDLDTATSLCRAGMGNVRHVCQGWHAKVFALARQAMTTALIFTLFVKVFLRPIVCVKIMRLGYY